MDCISENILMYAKELSVESDEIINFTSSVNPIGCSDAIINMIATNAGAVSEYSDRDYLHARESLSNKSGIEVSKVVFGNGTLELVYSFFRFFNPDKVLIISPVLNEYRDVLNAIECEIDYFNLAEDDYYKLDVEGIIMKLANHYDLFILCNPLNPAGVVFSKEDIIRVLKAASNYKTKMILDESFIDFTGEVEEYSLLKSEEKIKEFLSPSDDSDILFRNDLKVELFPLSEPGEFAFLQKLVIIRSFTKFFSISGMPVAFAFSHNTNLINDYLASYYSFPLNIFGEKVVSILCDQDDYIAESIDLIESEREFVLSELSVFKSIKVFPSCTNFIMFKLLNGMTAIELKEKLLINDKVLVRDLASHDGMPDSFAGIAVQAHDKNKILIEALRKYLD